MVIGCVDGMHIKIQGPTQNEMTTSTKKGFTPLTCKQFAITKVCKDGIEQSQVNTVEVVVNGRSRGEAKKGVNHLYGAINEKISDGGKVGKQNDFCPHPLNSRSGSATGGTSLLFTLKDFLLVHNVFDVIID